MSKLKIPVNQRDHIIGNSKSGIVLLEYGDYECPHCALAHIFMTKLLDRHGKDFLYVFRNFPLQESHPNAKAAALASEAAARQNKFWEMHNKIFENQKRLSNDTLSRIAEEIGLDISSFQSDINDPKLSRKVETDFESGLRSGVNGTPTFFVNGSRFNEYDSSYESLERAVLE